MGTWTLPQTKENAAELAKMMKSPIEAFVATDAIYNLLGDDKLSDIINEIWENESNSTDVRPAIALRLKELLEERDLALPPWEPEAVAICQKIVKKSLSN